MERNKTTPTNRNEAKLSDQRIETTLTGRNKIHRTALHRTARAEQVEVLQKRDKEMSDFMDKFDQTKGEALADQRTARATIVGLLEHISTGLESQHNVPDKGRMRVRKAETGHC